MTYSISLISSILMKMQHFQVWISVLLSYIIYLLYNNYLWSLLVFNLVLKKFSRKINQMIRIIPKIPPHLQSSLLKLINNPGGLFCSKVGVCGNCFCLRYSKQKWEMALTHRGGPGKQNRKSMAFLLLLAKNGGNVDE